MADMWMDVDVALAEVPVNKAALIDDTDFKTREESVTYDQAGMDLLWNFVTTGGAYTQTAVTPTTAGVHDWASQGNGMYSIEIPASGGTINNDTEGFGWFSGFATGILPWVGHVIGFRAAGLNNLFIDLAYSATRGTSGTALPDAAADAAGGVPISDAGGLDLDTKLANANEITAARLSELDEGTAGKMANQVDEIRTDTTVIGALGAGLTGIPWNSAWDAEVQSEAADALTAYDPPTKAEMDTAHALLATAAALTTHDGKLDTVDGIVDTILVDTAVIGALGAGLSNIPWNASWDAEVQSEVADAIIAYNLDHLCLTATGGADMTNEVADNTILSRILSNGDTSGFVPSTDGVQIIRDAIATVDSRVQAVDTDTSVLRQDLGTAGNGLTNMPWSASWDAEVQSEVTDALQTQLSDSVPADGTIPTFEQSQYMTVQFLTERAVSGTGVTVKKVDGATTLFGLTLDDADDPTSITRSS